VNILAIDLGTQMGWALTKRDGSIHGGSEGFQPAKNGGHGGKFLAFMTFLNQVRLTHGDVHAVYYEDVKMHQGVLAAHAYGGFLAILQVWCKVNNAPLYGMGVGQIKQSWSGKGNANKLRMIEVAKQRGFDPKDDNHADALAILCLACKQERRPFPNILEKPQGALL
jgi:Holliday junction resolvasome RuvABC endonuclease subunit